MCCFSRPIKHVSATQIFARRLEGDLQALVYSMNVAMSEELAMVLPIPVVPGGPEDALRFVDLSAYPTFFADLRRAFPERLMQAKSPRLLASARQGEQKLVVHDVGDFVASYVPSPKDFARLDERFRLQPEVLASREEYADWGFAVFQLKPRRGWFWRVKEQTVHPMAFTFPSRRPRAVFFPTLHVHDGHLPARARFDHSLYVQSEDPVLTRTFGFEESIAPLGDVMDTARTAGLVDGAARAYKQGLHTELTNQDRWLDPPRCRGPEVLGGRGELFSFELRAMSAYYTELDSARSRRWHDVASARLDDLHDGMLAGLRALTEEKREAWALVPPANDLERGWLSNDTASGPSQPFDLERNAPRPFEAGAAHPLRLGIPACCDDVAEPQTVELAFGRVPSKELVGEIRRALEEIVRKAVG